MHSSQIFHLFSLLQLLMFRLKLLQAARGVSLRSMATSTIPDLTPLKIDSINSKSLYLIVNIYERKYLVTKGDTIVLPYRLKDAQVGDSIKFDEVVELGSPQYTYHDKDGIPSDLVDVLAKVVEITREPLYQVVRRRPRCRKRRTIQVEPFQTHLVINELKLK